MGVPLEELGAKFGDAVAIDFNQALETNSKADSMGETVEDVTEVKTA